VVELERYRWSGLVAALRCVYRVSADQPAPLVLLESLATQVLVDLKDQLAHRVTLVLTARTELPKLVGSQSSRLLVLLQDQQKSQLVALLSPSSVVDLAKASRFL